MPSIAACLADASIEERIYPGGGDMKNQTAVFVILSIAILAIIGCAKQAPSGTDQATIIAVTFYPLEEIARNVAGNSATVFSMIPAGIEPHDYEPTPRDAIRMSGADAFVTIGLEFSPIERQLSEGVPKVQIIDAAQGIALLDSQENDEGDSGNHGKDPHIWVSPKNMIAMTENVKKGLIAANQQGRTSYEANTETYLSQLRALDADFTTGLSDCKKDVVLVNHAAFAYLAHDYGFTQIAIGGLEPDAEPTPQQITALIQEARKNDLKYVFYEELIDPRVAQAIAREVGAKVLELNPAEGTKNPDDSYISIMRRNLANLKLALECA